MIAKNNGLHSSELIQVYSCRPMRARRRAETKMITCLVDGLISEGMLSSALKVWTIIILVLFHVVFITDLTDEEDWGRK